MDIVQRLRNHALPDPHDEREVLHAPLLSEAADTIDRLRDELAEAREQIEALRVEYPAGWRFYTADNSILGRCHVLLSRDEPGRLWWLSLSEEEQEATPLYVSASAATLPLALRAAIDAASGGE